MTLGEYIDKYRRGYAALTYAEARAAGIEYPMQKGWPKRYDLLVVDEAAMRDALGARRPKSLPQAGSGAKVARKAAKKAKKRARFAMWAPVRPPAIPVGEVVLVFVAAPTDEARRTYVNSAVFLSSFEWRQLRFKALQKYGRQCQCCGASPASGAVMNVDHVKSRRRFPELALDIGNLQILCEDCNHGKANDIVDFRVA